VDGRSDGDMQLYDLLQENLGSEGSSKYIIRQHNKWRLGWDLWIIILILLTAVIVPYKVAFPESSPDDIYNRGIATFDLFFLIDIILSFFTSYIHPYTNKEVLSLKKVARHYICGWFFVDVISIIPIYYIT
jgi:hypothetical protein